MTHLMGAILVGGRSTRMGRDKASMRLPDGRTMRDAVVDALHAVCPSIAQVGGSDTGGVFACVRDLRDNCGPLGGIESLLQSNLADEYLICPCDVPLITPAVLRLLLHDRRSHATVLRIAGRERFEPLPARIAVTTLPTVTRLLNDGERSVWRLMDSLPATVVDAPAEASCSLRNVNTLDDFNGL